MKLQDLEPGTRFRLSREPRIEGTLLSQRPLSMVLSSRAFERATQLTVTGNLWDADVEPVEVADGEE